MAVTAEALFEEYCRTRQIPCARIQAGPVRSPDYEIRLADRPVAVEVKQLEPNKSDRKFLHELHSTGRAAGMVNMGRARSAIHSATKQLREHAQGRMPAIVVLYNTMGWAINYLDPYSIAFCMYGPEKVHYEVPTDPREDITYRGMSRGGKSVATPQHNTTLSAVATLRAGPEPNQLELTLFHNLHASIPLTWAEAANHHVPQFKFASARVGQMPEWVAWDGSSTETEAR